MSRFFTRGWQVLLDFIVLSAAYWLAFLFRFEFDIPLQHTKLLFFTWPYVVLLQYLVLSMFGVPRFAWRYVSMHEVLRVLLAMATANGVLVLLRLTLAPIGGYTRFVLIPLGVVAMNFVLAFLGVAGIRALRRIQAERQARLQRAVEGRDAVPTLLIGAGQAGVIVAREISARPDLGIKPIGFVDDDRSKTRTKIHGLSVLGTTQQIPELAAKHRAKHALITIANAAGADIRRITMLCRQAGLQAKIIPGIYEIVGGQVNLAQIRAVAIEDLLGREPVQLDEAAIAEDLRDKVVLVTGAGGSIGSELSRQVCRFGPKRLVLLEKGENALFEIHRQLVDEFPDVSMAPVVLDVRDAGALDRLMAHHRPHMVIHAAAHKHVPLMELNTAEAIKNNVFGTQVLADLADHYDVATFVMISTDKAVNPTSVMGASKRLAEIYVQALSQRSETRFVAVRFGNVLGSAGSVIPIFKEQIARGGPVTVTDPEMRRYFMTIPEASQLVLQAGTMGEGGEIFILDMGEPVKILDLATDLITLSGFRPNVDIDIKFTGMRPGEKLFEELSVDDEQADTTRHPKIFIGRIAPQDLAALKGQLAELRRVVENGSVSQIKAMLRRIIPEFNSSSTLTTNELPVIGSAAEAV